VISTSCHAEQSEASAKRSIYKSKSLNGRAERSEVSPLPCGERVRVRGNIILPLPLCPLQGHPLSILIVASGALLQTLKKFHD